MTSLVFYGGVGEIGGQGGSEGLSATKERLERGRGSI